MISRVFFLRRPGRRGIITVLVSLLLVVLIGMAAIALDGGLLQDNKRRVQASADAAALAAATALFSNFTDVNEYIPDPNGSAVAAAQASATANGFPNNNTTSTVTVNIPPTSGLFDIPHYNDYKSGDPVYAEVIVTYNQPRYFSTIWGTSSMPVRARAVACAKWSGSGNGVICLDPITPFTLDANGNGSAKVNGNAAVVVNSSDSRSAARTTGGGTLTADQFNVTGGTTGTFNGNVTTGTAPVPDPLRTLPVPAIPPLGTITQVSLGRGKWQYTLTPGRFTSLPGMNSGDEIILKQASAGNGGIYYLDGCGFRSTGADIKMDSATSGGVMLYNAPTRQVNAQGINITGNSSGTVNLTALTDGPYAGIVFWQERSSSIGLNVSGNGSFSLKGTFYAANARLSISGNGAATIGSQYISRTLNITGNGNITIDYSRDGTARERGVYLVE